MKAIIVKKRGRVLAVACDIEAKRVKVGAGAIRAWYVQVGYPNIEIPDCCVFKDKTTAAWAVRDLVKKIRESFEEKLGNDYAAALSTINNSDLPE